MAIGAFAEERLGGTALWGTVGWATGIGILPITTLMAVMGDRIETLAWEMWLLAAAGVLILWFVLRHNFRPSRELEGRYEPSPSARLKPRK